MDRETADTGDTVTGAAPTAPDRIRSKTDYRRFIEADMAARGQRKVVFCRLRRPVLYYQLLLRRIEYLMNTRRDPISRLVIAFQKLRLKRMGLYLGILVAPNTIGPGLVIRHQGALTISSEAQIGAGFKVNAGVNVTGVVTIGNNVTIGPGASISGGVTIGDNVMVAPNSLVISDIPEGATVMGVPAKIVFRRRT